MAARICAWNKPVSVRNRMQPTRARLTDGRSSSAIWSNWLGGWTDYERKKYWVLDDYRAGGVFHWRRRNWAADAISQQSPRHRAEAALPAVVIRDSRILENFGPY